MPGAEASPAEQPQIKHRLAASSFASKEGQGQGGPYHQQSENRGRNPSLRVTKGDRGEHGHHGREEEGQSGPVEAHPSLEVPAPGNEQQPGDHAEQPERHIDEEDEPPAACRQQKSPDRGTEGQSEWLGRLLGSRWPFQATTWAPPAR